MISTSGFNIYITPHTYGHTIHTQMIISYFQNEYSHSMVLKLTELGVPL